MADLISAIISAIVAFVIALIISTIIIWFVTKLLGEKEGLGSAFVVAIIGTLIYAIAYLFIAYLLPGNELLAAFLGGIAWLLVLKPIYNISWLKALLIAIIIWILAALVGLLLPTLTGPL